ncbi:hypothetical protein V6N13_015967 [Hibiscus sabdariffa]|uniref:AAA+ ATPase domain-containing protein n=1 Tax=Hibiscus sabdariffa TaxID=183260 RepID=A0ABR2CXB3_9ROSI
MDCVSPILDIVTRLWDCGARHVANVRNLGKGLEDLEIAMNELRDLRDDVNLRVDAAVARNRETVTQQVLRWMERVEIIGEQVAVLISQGKLEVESKCLGCCPRNMRQTYKIGKKVVKKIEAVKELVEKGNFQVISRRLPYRSVLKWPRENTVGLDSMVDTVWGHIQDGNVGIIGLYGMGGVGKTTLLKKINNEFSTRSHGFDFVICVTQSKAAYDEEFQDTVRRKLEVSDDIWKECSNESEKACEIFRVLSSTRFVLLLDDVQKRFNFQLTSLGIPSPDNQNGSKIVFTTRSEELCGYMGAQVRIKVECLPPEQALSLFSKTVGESILNSDPEIPRLAEIVAARCRGLPLALLTVGRAMASRKTPQECRYAIQVLQNHPSEFPGMGDHVFPLLKFSYDNLNSPITRNCFLYCSVFPENHMIRVDELVDLWIGEDLLDDRENPRDQGEFIIGTLMLSCLLDGDTSMESVSMHEVIRDMALWLARDEEENKNKVLVARSGRLTDQEFTKWTDSNWVSIWGSSDREINTDSPPYCPNLSTLLIRDTQLNTFPNGFFSFMSGLKALDLSGNQGLAELSLEIGRLITLQYLNLSLTSITKLPIGLTNLRNLRCLLLDYTMYLKEIPPREVMSCLSSLQVYSKINGVMEYFDEASSSADDELAFLEVLEGLEHMNKICITVFSYPSAKKIFGSHTLRRCIRKLTFMDCRGLTSVSPEGPLPNLRRLEMFRCCSLKEFRAPDQGSFCSLNQVHLAVCPLLPNLNCLAYARNLEMLTILDCVSMEEVIGEVILEGAAFPNLKAISLTRLPSLKNICRTNLFSFSMFEIEVSQCPRLSQLPIFYETTNLLKKIRGETEWWEALVWESDRTKDACSSKFISTSGPSGKAKQQMASTSKGKTATTPKSS